jgi:Tol biopolymer transport system component
MDSNNAVTAVFSQQPVVDDYGDLRSSATFIYPPTTLTGNLSTYYDADFLAFDVLGIGEKYTVTANFISGSSPPDIRLMGSSGPPIATDENHYGWIEYTPSSSGTLYLKIGDSDSGPERYGTGEYQIVLERIFATVVPTPVPTAVPTAVPTPTPTSVPTSTPTPTPTPIPAPTGGKIAFTSSRDGNDEIYVMNADGSSQTRITNNPAIDVSPKWSPDGTKIAFQSTRDGNTDIYVMNADGSGQTRLTFLGSEASQSWSPDGSKILFTSYRTGNHEIYVMDIDGSNEIRLTTDGYNGSPNWSPNGSRIVFSSSRDRVPSGEGQCCRPEIYVMDADGSNQIRITDNTSDERGVSWSPNGDKFVFSSNQRGTYELYTMNIDGSGLTLVTAGSANLPSWSPDGNKIVFSSSRWINTQIFVINADGSDETRLTSSNPGFDLAPHWKP